jgi:hypothetical protein
MSDVSVAIVESFERISDDAGARVEVKVDQADQTLLTVIDAPPCGEDSPPLAGDFAAIKEAPGGSSQAIGYLDSKNAGVALGGEKRFYARSPTDGSVICSGWLHGDGLIEFTSLKTGVCFKLGLVTIDDQGNILTPGEITAKAGTPQFVTLTQHVHPTGTGPSGPAQPGM